MVPFFGPFFGPGKTGPEPSNSGISRRAYKGVARRSGQTRKNPILGVKKGVKNDPIFGPLFDRSGTPFLGFWPEGVKKQGHINDLWAGADQDLSRTGQEPVKKWVQKWSKMAIFGPFLDPLFDPLFQGLGGSGKRGQKGVNFRGQK